MVVAGALGVPLGLWLLGRGGASEDERNERGVVRVVPSMPTIEGAGVRLRRALGGGELSVLDPFLLLDEFKSDNPDDYAAGFPEHPHRGFETVTYMIEGAMEHRDNVGNRGRLGPGSAQWMTAGHGIVHSEMPKQERGLMWGLQLWVNLPAARKMIKPRYQDIAPAAIAAVERERARLRVVAGTMFGTEGPVKGIDVGPTMLDVSLERGGDLALALPREHASFAYVLEGALRIGAREVRERELAVLGPGDVCRLRCDAVAARALLLAARPIGEPVARRGPFVMNSDDELRRAFEDYRTGRLTAGI
jgi:redox-sensitive bicupin YhaK (pirin superfamily)